MKPVTIYTDGGCSPNPGPGGWGVVILHLDGTREELKGAAERTTNNQMELTAAIRALEALARPSRIEIITDSQYLQKGITSWLKGWRKKGWLTRDGQPVKNQELWQALDREIARHVITWKWIKGHSGDPGNERADALARAALPAPELPLEDRQAVHLFCCVSYSGADRTGAYGVVLRHGDNRKQQSGRVEQTSPNRMHLFAVVESLKALKRPMKAHLYTTSSYVRDGATRWLPAWRQRGFQTATGQPVSHRDLWEQVDQLQNRHEITWHLVDRRRSAPKETSEAKLLSAKALTTPDPHP